MYSNMKHTVAELEYYILQYLKGMTFPMLKNLGLQYENTYFLFKVRLYQQHGIDGLQLPNKHQHYSSEFREQVAQEHRVDKISIYELAIKYNIPSQKTIRSWIFRYTNGGESQSYNSKPEVYLMKGKKTTYEEKLHIVLDYLKNDLSYRETAEKFQVSYNNVYAWVNKYKKDGPDGLIDSRGGSKPTAILTDKERLNVENKALKARNEYLEMENDALKKLQEVERELMSAKQGSKQSIKRLKNFTKKKPTNEVTPRKLELKI